MKPIKLIITLLIGVFFYTINDAAGATITSNGTGGGNWNVAATWTGSVVPTATDDAVIADGDVVTVTAAATCNKLTIQADASMLDGTSFTVNTAVNFTVKTDLDFAMLNSASTSFTLLGTSRLLMDAGSITNYDVGGSVIFTLDPASEVRYRGTVAQTIAPIDYGILRCSSTGDRILASSGTIGVAGSFFPGTNTYTVTGSTINYNGAATQTVSTSVPFFYNNLTSSGSGGRVLATSSAIEVAGVFTPGTNSYTVTGSTLSFTGAAAQTIPAFNYNNLTVTNTTTVTLAAAGTVGVAGTFTPGTPTYTITGSTVNFNGTAAQTVPAFNYNNLTVANTTTVTLAGAGTVGIAGAFTPAAATYTIAGSTVSFNGSAAQTIPAFNYNNLTVANTTTVTLASSGTVGIAGTFTKGTPTYTVTGSTVHFNGGSAQTIPAFTFNNLSQTNTSGVALAGDVNLIGVLTINSGTFTTTGFNMRLISDASGTARIAEITGGGAGPNIAGNIIMERYSTGPTQWRFLCSAVSGATIGSWIDDFATSGFTGALCPPTDCNAGCAATCNFPSIYSYNESVAGTSDNGFVAATNTTNTIDINKGLWVYLGTNPLTFDVTGPPHTFVQTPAITYNVSAGNDHDGWNQIANPYPSAIDWDDADWTKTNVDDVHYIWNSGTGSYASYSTTGGAVNGGSRYIASQQSFWVKANAVGPAISMNEGVKASAQDPAFLKIAKSPNTSNYPMTFKDFPVPLNSNDRPNSLLLTASGNGYNDEMKILFIQGATDNFDNSCDAWKLLNDTYVPNFSSVINGTQDLAINCLPPLTADVSIPIRLRVPVTGTYSIKRDSILMLPMSSCIILEDKKTAAMIDLRTTSTYTFTIADTTYAPRFILHVYAPITKVAISPTCSDGNNGFAIARGIGSGPWNYVWRNSLGTIVQTTPGSFTSDILSNRAADTYSVTVSGAYCGTVTDTITINAPAALVNTFSTTNISCFGENNGSASVSTSGSNSSYSYLWSNSQTGSAISNLSAGNYSVTVTDASGCSATASVSITQPSGITSTLLKSDVSCHGMSDASATALPSGGTAPYSFLWSNGEITQGVSNLPEGNHSVTITDVHGCPSVTATVTITAEPGALILDYTASTYTVDLAVNNTVTFTNTSTGSAINYKWDFGDTSGIYISDNPTHTYTFTGTYTVALMSDDGLCSDTLTKTIVVINSNPTALNGSPSASDINVAYENGDVYLLFSLNKATQVNISVYNMLGEEIFAKNNLVVQNEKIKLDLSIASSGIYIAVSEMTDAVISKKIFFPAR